MSGYFEIGIYHTKTETNVGTLWRSAYQLGAAGVFTIGRRYKRQASDTVNAMHNIPLRHYTTLDEFRIGRPVDAILIGIEMDGLPLSTFCHPHNAIYLLGAEDHGLPSEISAYCSMIVSLESIRTLSYNVAVAGSIVMYDRMSKKLVPNNICKKLSA
ncbi:MAG: RNA methyltransferase [Candidatus Nanoarchaeia archaeon]|nr:RNA methyltransferase [Candidatus Nanoarchaeia archaeon]